MPARPRFNPKQPLVAARDFNFGGRRYATGQAFPHPDDGPFNERLLARQYEARAVNHGEGAAADEQPAELVNMTGPAGGRYTITAPWLAEPEVVRGKVNAEKRLAELRAAGAPLGFIEGGSAVTVEEGEGGGWYAVNAPWLDEAEKLQGREAAEARQQELHQAGEPDSYKGYTLTAGDNGWYGITKDGVEGTDGAEAPVLKVQGEEAARATVAQLRAGETPADTALPAEWEDKQEAGGENAGNTEQPGAQSVEGAGNPAPEDSTVNKDKQTADTAPNEPGTNEPNGAEVINDQENAGTGTPTEGDGDGSDGGDGTTGTVGP